MWQKTTWRRCYGMACCAIPPVRQGDREDNVACPPQYRVVRGPYRATTGRRHTRTSLLDVLERNVGTRRRSIGSAAPGMAAEHNETGPGSVPVLWATRRVTLPLPRAVTHKSCGRRWPRWWSRRPVFNLLSCFFDFGRNRNGRSLAHQHALLFQNGTLKLPNPAMRIHARRKDTDQ